MFNWLKRKSTVAQYHDAKNNLETFQRAISNMSSLSDNQMNKHHSLIKKVDALKKASKTELLKL